MWTMPKRPIRYKEQTSGALGAAAASTWRYRAEPLDSPDAVILQGPCPECGDDFVYEWPLALFRDTSLATRVSESIPVICRCDIAHPGAGANRGCGRSWTLQVPLP